MGRVVTSVCVSPDWPTDRVCDRSIVNFGLDHLNGRNGLKGWQWMYVAEGLIACLIGILTYWWIVDFLEDAQYSFLFLSGRETNLVVARIQRDRSDVIPTPFSWSEVFRQFLDLKICGFAVI